MISIFFLWYSFQTFETKLLSNEILFHIVEIQLFTKFNFQPHNIDKALDCSST